MSIRSILPTWYGGRHVWEENADGLFRTISTCATRGRCVTDQEFIRMAINNWENLERKIAASFLSQKTGVDFKVLLKAPCLASPRHRDIGGMAAELRYRFAGMPRRRRKGVEVYAETTAEMGGWEHIRIWYGPWLLSRNDMDSWEVIHKETGLRWVCGTPERFKFTAPPTPIAEELKKARSGKCPRCGERSSPCDARKVHPATPATWEAYECSSCPWRVSMGPSEEK
jgi:hypothetical protein